MCVRAISGSFVILANDMFHKVTEKVIKRYETENSKEILFEWNDWLTKELKRKQMNQNG